MNIASTQFLKKNGLTPFLHITGLYANIFFLWAIIIENSMPLSEGFPRILKISNIMRGLCILILTRKKLEMVGHKNFLKIKLKYQLFWVESPIQVRRPSS